MGVPDRRAVLVLMLLGAAGVLLRFLGGSPGPPGAVAYRPAAATPRSSLDSVAARAARLARPLRRGDTIDLDRASEEDITRLPRVGPGLAARIVADREAHGAFGSLERLDRVSGIGPSVIEAVKPYVRFSGGLGGVTDSGMVRPGGALPLLPGEFGILREPPLEPVKRRTRSKPGNVNPSR